MRYIIKGHCILHLTIDIQFYCFRFVLPKNINKTINKGSVLSSLNLLVMNKPQSLSPQPQKSEKVISSHRMKSYSMENVAMNTYLNENHKIANFIIQK